MSGGFAEGQLEETADSAVPPGLDLSRGDRVPAINRWAILNCPSGAILNERNRRNEEGPAYLPTVRMLDTGEARTAPVRCCQKRFSGLPE